MTGIEYRVWCANGKSIRQKITGAKQKDRAPESDPTAQGAGRFQLARSGDIEHHDPFSVKQKKAGFAPFPVRDKRHSESRRESPRPLLEMVFPQLVLCV